MFGQIIESAQRQHAAFLKHPKFGQELRDKKRFGGFLCIADQEGLPLMIHRIGDDPDRESMFKRLSFCQEKAYRLGQHPEHVLSRESRDPAKSMWGGAVRGGLYIWSYSGDPEHLDEVKMMGLAQASGDLANKAIKAILARHPNDYVTGGDSGSTWFL